MDSFASEAGRWRQTLRQDGSTVPNDLTLLDRRGDPLGRIYRLDDGAHTGEWVWVVSNDIAPQGEETGHATCRSQARDAVEAIVWRQRASGGLSSARVAPR